MKLEYSYCLVGFLWGLLVAFIATNYVATEAHNKCAEIITEMSDVYLKRNKLEYEDR